MSGSALDPILEIMLLLRSNWTLTGTLASNTGVKFSTEYYDNNILFPQVVVSQAGGSSTYPLSMGTTKAHYRDSDILLVGVWVRPKQDSNTSKGWAKNAFYQIRKEVRRILRTGSDLGADADGDRRYLWLGDWRRNKRVGDRPLLLHAWLETRIEKTRTGSNG